jgi:hypothetical protein
MAYDPTFEDLQHLLTLGPVMVEGHPLLPLALPPDVQIEDDSTALAHTLDSPTLFPERRVLLTRIDPRWHGRFPSLCLPHLPPETALDRYLPDRVDTARARLGTQADRAARLAARILASDIEVVLVLLIDGLSYLECHHWTEQPAPVLVDGPSTTEFGFDQILRASGLVDRLLDSRRYRLHAYCYWDRPRNALTDRLFRGVAVQPVRTFAEAYAALRSTDLRGQVVFVLREGLDELAHRRRELSPAERAATVQEIHNDFRRLCALVADRGLSGLVCLLADHGIRWREGGEIAALAPAAESHNARYTLYPPGPKLAVPVMVRETPHYLLRPGLLARPPRQNEAGFHGGISAAESLVPFLIQEFKVQGSKFKVSQPEL